MLTNAVFCKLMKLERTLSVQQKRAGDAEVGMSMEDFKNFVTGVDELTDEDWSTLGIPKQREDEPDCYTQTERSTVPDVDDMWTEDDQK